MKLGISLAAILISVTSLAQQVRDVCGSYTYYAPETVSLAQAKETAAQRARIETLGDTFGRNIQSVATTSKSASEDGFTTTMLAEDQVKGEWLADTKETSYAIEYDIKGNLAVTATVYGKAREIPVGRADINVKVLRNGTDDRFALKDNDTFTDGDALFMSFVSPVGGYVAVYLVDESSAFCLLPYRGLGVSTYPVKADKEYVFFSEEKAGFDEIGKVAEYELTCARDIEFNNIYLIFSPNKFYKGIDWQTDDQTLPREMDRESFQKWLFKIRIDDSELVVNNIPVAITSKKM